MKTCGLIRFIKGDVSHDIVGCANYRNGDCLLGDKCKVEIGQRCSYFEKVVLPTAADLGIQETIGAAYSLKTNSPDVLIRAAKKARYCSCGEVLKSRQRLCNKCSAKNRKQAYRDYRRRLSLTRHS